MTSNYLLVSDALRRIRSARRRQGCDNCRSRTAVVYWGAGCSNCKEGLDLSEQQVAVRTEKRP